MLEFFREVLPMLDRSGRVRMVVASAAMVFLAVLEGLGLILLLPLLQSVASNGTGGQPAATRIMASILGASGGALELRLGLLVFAIYIIKGFAAVAVIRWNATYSLNEGTAMTKRLMLGYLRAPYPFHLEHNSAELHRTINGSVRQIYDSALIWAFGAVADLVSVAIIALVLVAADPLLAFVAIVYFTIIGLAYQRSLGRRARRASHALHEELSTSYRLVSQSLQVVKELKVLGREEHMAEEVADVRLQIVPHLRTATMAAIQPRYYLEIALVSAAAVIAAVAFSTRPVAQATALLGVFLAGGFRLLSPLNKVITGVTQAKLALPALAQVQADLKHVERFEFERQQLEAAESSGDVRSLVGNVSCHGVTFGYDPATPVLKGLSLEIRAGTSVALVGGSGAGKSTLVDVLLGLLEPQSGAVLIDGIPLAAVRATWQHSIGYVPQVIGLIDDTVRANIALGIPTGEVDNERVWEVLRLAQVDEVVGAMPLGVDTMIGEHGIRLSGGQRQRLGIARALYHDPKVIFLDEATSALDNETEAQVTETLRGLRGQMTMVTIAHRLSTIRDSDAVHFMAAGAIVASGSFEQLTNSMPEFARLVDLATLPAAS